MAVECPAVDGSSPKTQKFDGKPPMCIDPAKRYTATMETNKGTITFALDAVAAPVTVNNFVFLSRYHYYDDVVFHRVIPGFVVQGGDPTGTGTGGPGYRFEDELPKPGRYELGSLAMANAGPNTNGSQFFIICGASGAQLPPLYSLFGNAVAGTEVIAALEAAGSSSGRTSETVQMLSVTITEAE
jgi:cyclophilin family peptidyl-prolyl cis-trans isomerase